MKGKKCAERYVHMLKYMFAGRIKKRALQEVMHIHVIQLAKLFSIF